MVSIATFSSRPRISYLVFKYLDGMYYISTTFIQGKFITHYVKLTKFLSLNSIVFLYIFINLWIGFTPKDPDSFYPFYPWDLFSSNTAEISDFLLIITPLKKQKVIAGDLLNRYPPSMGRRERRFLLHLGRQLGNVRTGKFIGKERDILKQIKDHLKEKDCSIILIKVRYNPTHLYLEKKVKEINEIARYECSI